MSSTHVFVLVNILGGVSVLGSYIFCLLMYPEHREALWGGVDASVKPIFVGSMLIAALGYMLFLYFMIFKSGADMFDSGMLFGRFTPSIICAVFLIAGTIWMPATVGYLNAPQHLFWNIVVASLWVTATSLIFLTLVVLVTIINEMTFTKILSVCGLGYITLHCLILDAIIWVNRFPRVH